MHSQGTEIAILLRGTGLRAAQSVRTLGPSARQPPCNFYLVLDDLPAAEALNQATAMRPESHFLILEAGVAPVGPRWRERVIRLALGDVAVRLPTGPKQIPGLLIARSLFEQLGGFDPDRAPAGQHIDELLGRAGGFGIAILEEPSLFHHEPAWADAS